MFRQPICVFLYPIENRLHKNFCWFQVSLNSIIIISINVICTFVSISFIVMVIINDVINDLRSEIELVEQFKR